MTKNMPNFQNLGEVYKFLRNSGQNHVGFCYDISSYSRLYLANGHHPSQDMKTIGRSYNKSCWIVPMKFLDRLMEWKRNAEAENKEPDPITGRPYIPAECQSRCDIFLYNDCWEFQLVKEAEMEFHRYIAWIHGSLTNSIRRASEEVGKVFDAMEKHHGLEWQNIPLHARKPVMMAFRTSIRQSLAIAKERIENAVINAQNFEDTGKCEHLLKATRDIVCAEEEAIKAKYNFIEITPKYMK